MVNYHQQNTDLSQQEEQIEKQVRERAQMLNSTAESEDEQTAFEGCVRDHMQTAAEELMTVYAVAT